MNHRGIGPATYKVLDQTCCVGAGRRRALVAGHSSTGTAYLKARLGLHQGRGRAPSSRPRRTSSFVRLGQRHPQHNTCHFCFKTSRLDASEGQTPRSTVLCSGGNLAPARCVRTRAQRATHQPQYWPEPNIHSNRTPCARTEHGNEL